MGQNWSEPRIAPIDPVASPDLAASVAPSAAAGSKGTNWFLTAVKSPGLYNVWRPMARYLNSESVVPFRDRELAILRTAWLCQSDYEWGQHVLVARTGGIGDDEIDRTRRGAEAEGWTELERALLRVPDELKADSRVSLPTWSTLQEHYSEEQLIELIMCVGHYFMVAFTLNSIGVERESGVDGLESPPGDR
jgi:alkylhydroperoxidase family enzyme